MAHVGPGLYVVDSTFRGFEWQKSRRSSEIQGQSKNVNVRDTF